MVIKANDKIIGKNGGQYIVERVEGDKAICFPRGGGFQYRIPFNYIAKVVDNFEVNLKQGYAEGDWDEDVKYPCICDPRNRWNGWAKPQFTKEVFKQIIKENDLHVIGHEDGYIKLVFSDNDIENCTYVCKANNRYIFDGWCWDFVEK